MDVFTKRMCASLNENGIRAEIAWLPLRAEYAPWSVAIPKPPPWANVVHVNTWLPARFLPKGLPVVATVHHSIHDPALAPYKGLARKLYHQYWIRPVERRVMRRAATVVAVSRFAAEMARDKVLDRPIQVIHNGIDISRFRPGNRQRKPDAPFRLLYVGSWTRLKGVDLLAPIMRELGESFELYCTGGPAADGDRSGMPGNMHDLGRLQGDAAVAAAMQDADAFLFPTRSEGFGLVAAEAMACGLPVIATNVSSLPDIVTTGKTGFLCQRDNVASFLEATRRLESDIELSMSMSDAASNIAAKRFDLDTMVKSYLDIYRRMV